MSDLIDRQALKAAHGLGTDCADCKRDARSCQYDRDFSRMDFCEWIDDAPTASPWHRVEEGMPDDSREVIIFTVSGIIGVGSFIRPNWYQWYSGGGLPVDVTHWMPLPEPPKEDAYGDT